ncbi:unnamed protein product, partial [Hapterophycus canaliculatus]
REHIVADCCSDAPKQALYFEAGRDPETLCALFRCVRGTNDLEGYHFHMRLLVAWCLSPRLAHLLLLEHNYRWIYVRASRTAELPRLSGDSTTSRCSRP